MVVSEDIEMKWDGIWQEVNMQFEEELQKKQELQVFFGKMFFVWEGNHRTVAWMQAIKESYERNRGKHCRVLCTVIDPTKVSKIALLSSLQRMNV